MSTSSTHTIVIDETVSSQEVKKMKWLPSTTEGYKRQFTQFAAWLSLHQPEMVNENGLTANFKIGTLLTFCSQKKKKDIKTGKLVNLSFSGLNSYRSAVAWEMKNKKMKLSQDETDELSQFFSGLRKRHQQEKQKGERQIEEGKREMPFEVYLALARYFWKKGKIFEVVYLILSWNLACRTNNTEGIQICHISWLTDALKIEFGVTKTNQAGDRRETRLLFANPDHPVICPVLALGVYFATLSTPLNSSDKLFPGGSQAVRFYFFFIFLFFIFLFFYFFIFLFFFSFFFHFFFIIFFIFYFMSFYSVFFFFEGLVKFSFFIVDLIQILVKRSNRMK